MRLKEFEIEAIKNAVKTLDVNAGIYLFGSRTDDNKRGGDIDLIIISDKIKFGDKYKIYSGITKVLEEQKIDIIISDGKNVNSFIKETLRNSVQL